MYMKSLVSLAVLGAMSAVATAGDLVVFDNPNESYTVDRLSKYGATIKASDITITNTTYNGIDAYGVFDLNAAKTSASKAPRTASSRRLIMRTLQSRSRHPRS